MVTALFQTGPVKLACLQRFISGRTDHLLVVKQGSELASMLISLDIHCVVISEKESCCMAKYLKADLFT